MQVYNRRCAGVKQVVSRFITGVMQFMNIKEETGTNLRGLYVELQSTGGKLMADHIVFSSSGPSTKTIVFKAAIRMPAAVMPATGV
jgi:hypothetical protein